MKWFSAVVATGLVCAAMMGCHHPTTEDPHMSAIRVRANHSSIMTGETTEVSATTINLVGGNGLKWTVNPSTASVTPDRANGMIAIFAANEPGTYVIRASCQMPDGSVVWSNSENVTVSGPPRTDRGNMNAPGAAPAPVIRK
jgi:hypothetical protein